MNCSVFKRKVNDYIEDNMSGDLRQAMESHMEDCENCKKIYEEEIKIDNMFKGAFDSENIEFTSSREEIMKNINKKRYSEKKEKKFGFHIRRHIGAYIAVAAFLICVGTFTYARNYINFGNSNNANSVDNTNQSKKQNIATDNSGNSNQNVSENNVVKDNTKQTTENKGETSYIPKFTQSKLDAKAWPTAATPLKDSPNKQYVACVEGKGTDALEEGIGSIFVKDMKSGDKYSFQIVKDNKQFTPKYIEWKDDENLLVIVGYGYGTVSVGGNVYNLNIKTAQVTSVYESKESKEQVFKIAKVKDDSYSIEVRVYDDSEYNKFHNETRKITIEK